MTTVLIALDASDEAHAAAAAAHRIFGDSATYLAINVAAVPLPAETYAWGSVFGYPYPPVAPAVADEEYSGDVKLAAVRRPPNLLPRPASMTPSRWVTWATRSMRSSRPQRPTPST